MIKPWWIEVPAPLYAGARPRIYWMSVPGAAGYRLFRKYDDDPDFTQVYDGADAECTVVLPHGKSSVVYAVHAYGLVLRSWSELDAAAKSWSELDAQAQPWGGEQSDLTISERQEIIPTPLIISGVDGSLGTWYEDFVIPFTVSDPNPENRIDITVTLDDSPILTLWDTPNTGAYSIPVTGVSQMEEGGPYYITVTASSTSGLTAVRSWLFFRAVDIVSDSVFYVLRDGLPVARLTTMREWTDYLSVGTHTYVIRGVDASDNYTDSNPVTLTVALKSPTIAPVDTPGEMMFMNVRRGERPRISRKHSSLSEEVYFEGRRWPVPVRQESRGETLSLSYTHTREGERERLDSMIGEIVIYRDHYGNRFFGLLRSEDSDFLIKTLGALGPIVDYTVQISRVDYPEGIDYD